ncbi:hypothetical protein BOTBODRAFT_38363 [Botryobasidium botryosum FD-172 SS1]|uniref:Glutamine amidotransferase type-2 domain-containing protein n=1 Tax=Botryobasidium botryosum (strain FD-172 SS1) TaxID=930990 RepID=A0A067M8M7_BOTB1|nr:hypothetical protein BOTBODRAFT_38363 [Botryobasidium botryosum FD-172 SS1]
MCGLTAVYYAQASPPPSTANLGSALNKSLETIKYRGPDSSGTWVSDDARVGLGHVRLSIIGLANGLQPLSDESGTVHCVVNGEFYGFEKIRTELEAKGSVFATETDSEILIHLYKHYSVNFVQRLRGEFAFVLYDSTRQLLFAARDRSGIKPLYYTLSGGRLLIASELKALPALGLEPKWDVESILQMGEYFDDRTILKGVQKIPPGYLLTFRRSGHLFLRSYWDHNYPDAAVPDPRTVEEMVQGARERMIEAVRLRLRSDVPVAVYLSGGIDSSSVAGIATSILREKNPEAKISTFTLGFPGTKDLDEGPSARRTAEFLGADAHMVEPSEKDLVEAFEESVWHAESPYFAFNAAGKLLLSKFVHNQGYKVVLTGEGADETFGGYIFFIPDYLRAPDPATRDPVVSLPTDAERAVLLHKIESTPAPVAQLALQQMSYTDQAEARSVLGGISTPRSWAAILFDAELFVPEIPWAFGKAEGTMMIAQGLEPRARENAASGKWHPLHTSLYVGQKVILPWLLSAMGERLELANSVESRPAFLDHALVEYVNSLPPSVKVRPVQDENGEWTCTEKWILREAARPFVTDELYRRRKMHYNTPIARPSTSPAKPALTPLGILLQNRVTKENVERLGWANWSYVEGLLNEFLGATEWPTDGGLSMGARKLLGVLSLITLGERLQIPAWSPRKAHL